MCIKADAFYPYDVSHTKTEANLPLDCSSNLSEIFSELKIRTLGRARGLSKTLKRVFCEMYPMPCELGHL